MLACGACSGVSVAHTTVNGVVAGQRQRASGAGGGAGGGANRGGPARAGSASGRRSTGSGLVEQAGPPEGHLRRVAGGVVLLRDQVDPTAVTTPRPGVSPSAWRPVDPLPAAEPAGTRHVDVFYTPHPDDETLSMGVLIAAAVGRGDRVIVVSLTDGRTTGAVTAIDSQLAAERRHRPGTPPALLTEDEVAAARIGELRRATADLGVAAGDVFLAHLDGGGTDGGGVVTVAEAAAVIRAFAARYPGATHVTMSDAAERQQDHLDAGVALRQLLDVGIVTAAQWTVSRLWWQLPVPRWSWALPTPADRSRVRRAALEYELWNPADGEYAVGFHSVRWQFAALAEDVRDRVHGTGPLVAGAVPTR